MKEGVLKFDLTDPQGMADMRACLNVYRFQSALFEISVNMYKKVCNYLEMHPEEDGVEVYQRMIAEEIEDCGLIESDFS